MRNIKRKIGSMLIDYGVISRSGLIYRFFSKNKVEKSGVTSKKTTQPRPTIRPDKPISLLIEKGIFNKPNSIRKQSDITILIPFYSNLEGVYNLILSILEHELSHEFSFKVLIANDNPDMSRILQELMDIDEIIVLNNPKNLGFLLNVNNAVKEIDSEYTFLLNDDVTLLTSCLGVLKHILESNDNVMFASPVVMGLDGKINEYGAGISRTGEAYHHERGGVLSSIGVRRVAYVSGCSLFFKTREWLELGGADEIFSPGYYEDASICLSAWEKNQKFSVATSLSLVYHQEGATHGISTDSGVKSYQVSNQMLFQKKHHRLISTGFLSDRFLSSSYASTVLFIDSLIPADDLDSGSQDTYFQLKEFVNLNCKVFFYAFDDPRGSEENSREKYMHRLASENIEIIYNRDFDRFEHFFRKLDINPDIVVLSRVTVADKCLHSVRKIWPNTKIVFNTVDIHSIRQTREGGLDPTPRNMVNHGWKVESRIIMQTDFCWVVSEYERDFIEEHLGVKSSLSMVKDFENIHAHNKNREGLVFVGSGMHTPNIQSVDHLVRLRKSKEIKLPVDVIGSNQDYLIENLKENNPGDFVNFLGHVPDIRNELGKYKAGLAILSEGAGVKGKVLDYLASGCYVLANSVAIEGINPELVQFIDVVNESDIAKKITEVCSRKSRSINEINEIHRFLCKYFGRERFRNMIQSTLLIDDSKKLN